MDEPRAVAEILDSKEFAWPDLTGRKVLLIAVGESELAVDALALHPELRKAAKLQPAKLRDASRHSAPALEGFHWIRTQGDHLRLLQHPDLPGELARLEFDVLVAVDLGGPLPPQGPKPEPTRAIDDMRGVMDLLRQSGRQGFYVVVGPGCAGAWEQEILEQLLAALALTIPFAGATPVEPLRRRLRRAAGRTPAERIAAFLGNLATVPAPRDPHGRVQVPAGHFPWLPPEPQERMLVFSCHNGAILARSDAAALLARLSDPQLLGAVACRHSDPGVRLEAARRARRESIWEALLQQDPDLAVRREAVKHLRRPGPLQQAVTDPDRELSMLARRRLAELGEQAPGGDLAVRLHMVMDPLVGGRKPASVGLVGLLLIAVLLFTGWYLHGLQQADGYFEEGRKLEAKGDPAALLWYARAAASRPSHIPFRDATARLLLGQPSLAFGQPLPKAAHVALSADGTQVASATGASLTWRGETRDLGAPITSLSFAPDSGILAVASQDRLVRVLDGGKTIPLVHGGPVLRVKAGTQGRIATVDAGGTVRFWTGGKLVGEARTPGVVTDLDPDRQRWAVVHQGAGEVWTLGRNRPLPLPKADRPLLAVRLGPGEGVVATLDEAGGARIWEPGALGWRQRIAAREADVVEFAPDGVQILTVHGKEGRFSRTAGAVRTATFLLPDGAREVAFSADGSRLATAGDVVRVARTAQLRTPEGGLPDLDKPVSLLELEARLYSRCRLDAAGEVQPLSKEALKAGEREWERQAEEHARVCQWPASNLWLLLRGPEGERRDPEPSSPTP